MKKLNYSDIQRILSSPVNYDWVKAQFKDRTTNRDAFKALMDAELLAAMLTAHLEYIQDNFDLNDESVRVDAVSVYGKAAV